jgi:hypothetical protein
MDGDGLLLLIKGCKAIDRKAQKKLYELFAPSPATVYGELTLRA